MIDHSIALLAFMFLVVALSRYLENRFVFVQKISSAVVCTLLGIFLANVGVIPHESEVFTKVGSFAVPYAIVLVILSSRLKDMRKAGKSLVLAFLLAGIGTFVGASLASLLFASSLGPETWKLGGTFAGAFWGGGMNFAAVGKALEMNPDLYAAAFVVDNLSTVPWMLAQVGLYALLAPYYRSASDPDASVTENVDPRKTWSETRISITDFAWLAALPLVFMWVTEQLTESRELQTLGLTTLAFVAAQIPVTQRLRGAAVLSYFALHLFFITIGAVSDVQQVVKAGPILFVYMIAIIAIHALFVYGVGFLARFDLPTLTIASQAAVGGPGSALALGMAMKWNTLVTPGIIVAIFGYGVGTYLGFATAYILRSFL